MNERELFLSALEIQDREARQAHLHAACADDPELLARVEALLASHESQSQFLNTPALEQISHVSDEGLAPTLFSEDSSSKGPLSPDTAETAADEFDTCIKDKDDMTGPILPGILEPSSRPDSFGRLGHYEILEVIGKGAFGTVLKAFDEKLHRVVAIKVLAPEMAATSPARKRFLREARTSAAVRHDNVVSIFAVEDEPTPYLVMEYIPGKTLQQQLDEQGPLALNDVLLMGKQIADGLAAAHEQQLIHRDIKPGNILLESGINAHVKITDFGLARTADDASMTQSGMIAGTPLYMAPEQALGQKLDQRADLFSLGSVLYQMLSGRPPFRAPSTVAVLKRVAEEMPRPIQEIIPEAPDWICQLIGNLHAKNPDERYSSAKEVSDLLARCLDDVQAGRVPQLDDPHGTVAFSGKGTPLNETRKNSKKMLSRFAVLFIVLLFMFGLTEMTGLTSMTPYSSHRPESLPAEAVETNAEAAEPAAANAPAHIEKAKAHIPPTPPLAKAPFTSAE
ncbi:MAG: serine/threonine protein kinase, partial [Planctomycetaceae bacterium]|nr:serine/threonine protein kinase [Planctomycetaceae bacterium]